MAAPKGNKYALGKATGLPKTYTQEWLAAEAERFREWMERDDSLFIGSFAIERGYSPQRLAEFARDSEDFAVVYRSSKEWQELKLLNMSIHNKINFPTTKMFLAKHHGYIDNPKVIVQQLPSPIPAEAINSSAELVNESD